MTEVSTRPPLGANDEAPTSTPVAASAPVENEALKPEDNPESIYYRPKKVLADAERAALLKLSELFDEAAYTDEAHEYSGESDRYLRIASELAERFSAGETLERSLQNFAFDLAALVNAARLVPGDTESPARKALLEQAKPLLQRLADDEAGDNIIQPAAARPYVVAPRLKRETPIQNCGEVGLDLIRQCTYDIATLSDEILARAAQMEDAGSSEGVIYRALADRISRLNSIIMSFHSDDDRQLGECFRVVWNGSRDINEVVQ